MSEGLTYVVVNISMGMRLRRLELSFGDEWLSELHRLKILF